MNLAIFLENHYNLSSIHEILSYCNQVSSELIICYQNVQAVPMMNRYSGSIVSNHFSNFNSLTKHEVTELSNIYQTPIQIFRNLYEFLSKDKPSNNWVLINIGSMNWIERYCYYKSLNLQNITVLDFSGEISALSLKKVLSDLKEDPVFSKKERYIKFCCQNPNFLYMYCTMQGISGLKIFLRYLFASKRLILFPLTNHYLNTNKYATTN